jgi:hypothetical protein
MKSKIIIGVLGFSGLAVMLSYGALPIQTRTVKDGVYTSTQADRGAQTIEDYGCRNCHGGQLEGGLDEQPQLIGDEFVNTWNGRKLDELAEKITTMPADADEAYHVKRAAASDVVAYLLRSNGFPAGAAELPADPTALKLIQMTTP